MSFFLLMATEGGARTQNTEVQESCSKLRADARMLLSTSLFALWCSAPERQNVARAYEATPRVRVASPPLIANCSEGTISSPAR